MCVYFSFYNLIAITDIELRFLVLNKDDPRFNEIFNIAKTNHITFVMRQILEHKGFKHIKTLIDVASGLGVDYRNGCRCKAIWIIINIYNHATEYLT